METGLFLNISNINSILNLWYERVEDFNHPVYALTLGLFV